MQARTASGDSCCSSGRGHTPAATAIGERRAGHHLIGQQEDAAAKEGAPGDELDEIVGWVAGHGLEAVVSGCWWVTREHPPHGGCSPLALQQHSRCGGVGHQLQGGQDRRGRSDGLGAAAEM